MSLIIGFLTGCNQIEDILSKMNQLLDEQITNNHDNQVNDEEVSNIHQNNNVETLNNEQHESHLVDDLENGDGNDINTGTESVANNKPTSDLPFDERLISQGYEFYVFPNGFPFHIPYHWVFVEDQTDDPIAEGFEGIFCFDLPLGIEKIAHEIASHYDDVTHEYYGNDHDIIHETTFSLDLGYETWDGSIDYFLDEYDNTCAHMVALFQVDDGENYGEAPETMISDEELAVYEDIESISGPNEDRVRSLPDNYEDIMMRLKEDSHFFDEDGVLSISEKIRNGEQLMIHLDQGYPKIFPYEWYLLEELSTPEYMSWSGTMCTDTSMTQAITKHLHMLEDYYANISYIATEGIVKPNVIAELGFAFNDAYGTGSWHGTSLFFIAPDGTFPMHKCMTVSMEFSDEILD